MIVKMRSGKSPKTAMVLAAGFGERMRPLTDKMPKPLVEVAGKPLIEHVLDKLAEAGVETAVVNVHYLADMIEKQLAARKKPRIVISDERKLLLNTGGGVVKALPLLGAAPFYLVNSDSIWIDGVRGNLARLAENFDPARMDALLLLAPVGGQHRLCRPRGFRDDAGRPPARARRARGGALRLCRRRDALALAVQGRAGRRLLADDSCSTGRRRRSGSTGFASTACGCMSARPTRSGSRKTPFLRARSEPFSFSAQELESRPMIGGWPPTRRMSSPFRLPFRSCRR